MVYQDQNKLHVACRKCRECIQQQKIDWIGRALAEEKTATAVWFATFTYAGGYDNAEAYALNYKDMQDCLKRMRKGNKKLGQRPLDFSYIAVGERGDKKNRAHFHVMFFWKCEPPNVPMNERIDYVPWGKGTVQFEIPRSARGCAVYIMDYLDKDPAKSTGLKYSKAPALGYEYLVDMARRTARAGLALFQNGNRYSVPGSTKQNGKPFLYNIKPDTVTYRDMVLAYFVEWTKHYPDRLIPINEIMEEHIDEYMNKRRKNLPDCVREYLERQYEWTDHLEDVKITRVYTPFVTYTVYPEATRIQITKEGFDLWHSTASRDTLIGLIDAKSGMPRTGNNDPTEITERIIAHLQDKSSDHQLLPLLDPSPPFWVLKSIGITPRAAPVKAS